MFSGFHVCSPYCGYCKPPKKFALRCESCGWTDYDGEGAGACPKCGAALPLPKPPAPIRCAYVDEVCIDPCGRGRDAKPGMVRQQKCSYHTPPPN